MVEDEGGRHLVVAAMDLWTAPVGCRAVTTNGDVNWREYAVMGRGCAREAAVRYPELPRVLGELLVHQGNHVHVVQAAPRWVEGHKVMVPTLVTFPVKHHWRETADLALIERSALELADLLRTMPELSSVALPKPGCGAGGLRWGDVAPVITRALRDYADRVVVVEHPVASAGQREVA